MNLSTTFEKQRIYRVQWTPTSVKQRFEEAWSLFKSIRETFCASTVTLSSSKQFIYSKISMSVCVILASNADCFSGGESWSFRPTSWQQDSHAIWQTLFFTAKSIETPEENIFLKQIKKKYSTGVCFDIGTINLQLSESDTIYFISGIEKPKAFTLVIKNGYYISC